MAITYVNSAVAKTSSGNAVTAAADFTGSSLLVAWVFAFFSDVSITDSQGNTWTTIFADAGGTWQYAFAYCESPSVSASQTFTANIGGAGNISSVCVSGYAGTAAVSALDQSNGAGAFPAATTLQPGSITPSVNGCVIVNFYQEESNNPQTVTVDSGLSIRAQVATSTNTVGTGVADIIQSSASAINPTWSSTSGTLIIAVQASFKPAGGGGTTWPGYIAPFGWR